MRLYDLALFLEVRQRPLSRRLLHALSFALGKHTKRGALDRETTVDAIKALAELRLLESDKAFKAEYLAGDVAAKERFQALHERAYPPELDEGGEE